MSDKNLKQMPSVVISNQPTSAPTHIEDEDGKSEKIKKTESLSEILLNCCCTIICEDKDQD